MPSPAQASHPVHLAIDLGASGGRVIAGGLDDSKLSLQAVARFDNEPVAMQNSLQWNVHGLWSSILSGLRKASLDYADIQSVGVDSWGVDYALVDAQGLLAGPVRHYRDGRNRGTVQRVTDKVPRETIFEQTGLQFMEINSLMQLFAAKEAGETSLEAAEDFMMIGDFFHWLLSGQRSIEVTNASTTQLLDPRTKSWSTDLMDQLGIPSRLFKTPTEPGTQLGVVQPSIASITGLDATPVMVPATHDTASAVLAVPADGFAPEKPDWCYISSGTWSLMGCELPEPKITSRCAELNFTNEGGVRGSTRLLKNIGGLWIFQQIRRSLERRGKPIGWDDMVAAAASAPQFELILNPDDPEFTAPADMIDSICAYAGRTGQAVPVDDAVLFRASLEGLALRYRVCLSMLESIAETSIRTIHVVGGGSQNALLCQMTADACNRRVVAGPVEATATGNVLMQLLGSRKLQSIDEARQLVLHSFDMKTYEPEQPERWDEPADRFEAQA